MITPQEYSRNDMHQVIPLKPDIENNMLEVMKHKLMLYDERLVRMEEKIRDKTKCENKCFTCLSDWFKFLEAVCLWTMVILLWKKVFN
jgi:hypothetical protein